MPAHASRPQAVPAAASSSRSNVAVAKSDRKVLYVEDNPANISFMQDLLSSFDGLSLVTTSTAEQGVAVAQSFRPDVILININLPGISGLEAMRRLRGLPETQGIPVIALTAAASERDRQRGEQAGFYRYLTKPLKVDELLDTLEGVFDL